MTKLEWINSLNTGQETYEKFSLSERSYRARRALLLFSSLAIVISTFNVEFQNIPAVGIEFSMDQKDIFVLLIILAGYFWISFFVCALSDLNERPLPLYRQRAFKIWARGFDRYRETAIRRGLAFLDEKLSPATFEGSAGWQFKEVYQNAPSKILDENKSKRFDLLSERLQKIPAWHLDDADYQQLRRITSRIWFRLQIDYWRLRGRVFFFATMYCLSIFGLEVAFPLAWGGVALLHPDLSYQAEILSGCIFPAQST